MKNILFCCDLDNTLLYSHKHKKAGDVCVEILKDKEQGFMTRETIRLLKLLQEKVILLPVTTRSVEQYRRIQWPEGTRPLRALVANGAILLEGDEIVPEWRSESATIIADYSVELERMLDLLSVRSEYIRCRCVDDFYLFVYVRDGIDPHSCIDTFGPTELNVVASGRKIYFLPPGLDKGTATERFRRRHSVALTVVAGDSIMDVSMLRNSDVGIVPNTSFLHQLSDKKILVKTNCTNFAEFALSSVMNM